MQKIAVPLGVLNIAVIILVLIGRGISPGTLIVAAPWVLVALYCLGTQARVLWMVASCLNVLVALAVAAAIYWVGLVPDDQAGFNFQTLFSVTICTLAAILNPIGLWLLRPRAGGAGASESSSVTP